MNLDGLSATSMKKFNLTEVMNRAQFDRFNSNVLRRKVLIKVFADGARHAWVLFLNICLRYRNEVSVQYCPFMFQM